MDWRTLAATAHWPSCVALASAAAVRRKRLATLAAVKAPGGKRSIGMAWATELKRLAETSVAPPEMEAQATFEIGLLIAQHDLLKAQIEQAEARVEDFLGALNASPSRRPPRISRSRVLDGSSKPHHYHWLGVQGTVGRFTYALPAPG